MAVPLVVHVAEYAGFVMSLITNSLLLYLIATKARKQFGAYKHIMLIFCCFGIGYSFVSISAQPIYHSYKASFVVMVGSWFQYDKTIGTILITLYCACFGMCLLLLALHFTYRYIAVCKPTLLYLFDGKKLIFSILIPFFFAANWYVAVYYMLEPNSNITNFNREAVKESYGEDLTRIAYIAALYYERDAEGNYHIYWDDILCIVNLILIMGFSLSVIGFCGYRIHVEISADDARFSKRTKELHKQLFYVLIVQTAIPIITMYTPVGSLFLLPFLEFKLGALANSVPFYLALYPSFDPLVAIILIRDFREALLSGLRKRQQKPDRYCTKQVIADSWVQPNHISV
ncbi:unnamed protein product [Caenorhabditis auriculariae]|uniref:Serpentine receptor class r-10 n=1 Tax=Caenorhabditis auriculariae TaxID=2777116 RepID=A0A8S1HEN3_9PELO|nr:unnamed protein product [Caenorhabditis auriculariae]